MWQQEHGLCTRQGGGRCSQAGPGGNIWWQSYDKRDGNELLSLLILQKMMMISMSRPSDLDLRHVEAVFQQPQSNPVQAFVELGQSRPTAGKA